MVASVVSYSMSNGSLPPGSEKAVVHSLPKDALAQEVYATDHRPIYCASVDGKVTASSQRP